jgi:hypothetical protein
MRPKELYVRGRTCDLRELLVRIGQRDACPHTHILPLCHLTPNTDPTTSDVRQEHRLMMKNAAFWDVMPCGSCKD